ncbi:MAG: DUF362 domain-containing protein [Planctomycetes bacterium]|nr:DUF362 domain-containing protein [Planctomycetota bacterium]
MTEPAGDAAGVNRRDFLRFTSAAALAAFVSEAIRESSESGFVLAQSARPGEVTVMGISNHPSPAEIDKRTREAILATDDLSWLKPGQTVAINVASNSPRGYPFTTHPEALKAAIRLFRERGAKVIVADQAGMEHVAPPFGGNRPGEFIRKIWSGIPGIASGHRTGMEVLKTNGLLDAAREAGAEVRSFDREEDWVRTGPTKNWPKGFRIPKLAVEADHLVNMARPGAHVMAGHTGTIKNWYGWLHPVDRFTSHSRLGFNKDGFGVVKLDESIAEVAGAFKDKTRLNLVPAIGTYTDVGPDWGSQPLESSMILASKDPLAIDAATAALIHYEKHRVPLSERRKNWRNLGDWRNESMWGSLESFVHRVHGNSMADRLDRDPRHGGVWDLRSLHRGREIGLGSGDVTLKVFGDVHPATVNGLTNLTGGRNEKGLLDALEGPGH